MERHWRGSGSGFTYGSVTESSDRFLEKGLVCDGIQIQKRQKERQKNKGKKAKEKKGFEEDVPVFQTNTWIICR